MPIEFLLDKKKQKPSARPHVSFGANPESANALLLEKVTKLKSFVGTRTDRKKPRMSQTQFVHRGVFRSLKQ